MIPTYTLHPSSSFHVLPPSAIVHSVHVPTKGGAGTAGIAGNIVVHVLYNTLKGALGIVGLTPRTTLYVIGTIVVSALVVQIVGAFRGKQKWTLDDPVPSVRSLPVRDESVAVHLPAQIETRAGQ